MKFFAFFSSMLLAGSLSADVSPIFTAPSSSEVARSLSTADAAAYQRLDGVLRLIAHESSRDAHLARSTADFRFTNGERYGDVFQEWEGWPVVDITHRGDLRRTEAELRRLSGVEILGIASTSYYDVISCRIMPGSLLGAARLSGIKTLTAAQAMTGAAPSTGESRSRGAANNQAEEALGVEKMRLNTFGLIQGSGISIGTLSDSVNQVGGGIASSQGSGDLPPNNKLNILNDFTGASATDEGRAMMEHIYDIAPLATSYGYATAFGGKATFANNITALATAGMDIINDDVIYLTEAIYQDDVVAQVVNDYVDDGGIYFALNHNYGRLSREFTWVDGDGDNIANFTSNDERLTVTVSFGSNANTIALFWSEPWANATTELTLNAYSNGSLIASSSDVNPGANPYDSIALTGSGVVQLEVVGTGSVPQGLTYKIIIFHNGVGSTTIDEYPNNMAGTLTPHAGTPKSIAIGAAPFYDQDVAEGFSGRGPFKQFFNENGTPYFDGSRIYNKPDFISIDACNTTFFGRDVPEDDDTLPNFFGTSAATPNAAAVGALVLQAAGGPNSLTRDEMAHILQVTAEDLGNSGFDTTYGQGRINAIGAVLAALKPFQPVTYYPSQWGSIIIEGEELDNSLDRDVFRFSYERAGYVTMDYEGLGGDADPFLLMFDDEDVVQQANYDQGVGFNQPFIGIDLDTAVYTAQVQSEGGFDIDSPYRFEIIGPGPELIFDVTLNALGDASRTGSISPIGDLDYYRFIVPEDNDGSIRVSGQSSLYTPAIRLFDIDGTPLGGVAYEDFVSGNENHAEATISDPIPGAEIHVLIAGKDYVGIGAYSLNIVQDTNGLPDALKPLPQSLAWVVRPNPVTGTYQTLTPLLDKAGVNYTLWVPNSEDLGFGSETHEDNLLLSGLYGPLGNLVSYDGPKFKTNHGYTADQGEQYFHRLYAYDDASGFFLASTTFQEKRDPEKNASLLTLKTSGNTMAANVVGTISIQGENDYYRFVVPAGASGTGSLEVVSTGNLDVALEAFLDDGTSIGKITDNPLPLSGAQVGQQFYIMVRGAKDAQQLGDATQIGEYKVGVVLNRIPPTTVPPTTVPPTTIPPTTVPPTTVPPTTVPPTTVPPTTLPPTTVPPTTVPPTTVPPTTVPPTTVPPPTVPPTTLPPTTVPPTTVPPTTIPPTTVPPTTVPPTTVPPTTLPPTTVAPTTVPPTTIPPTTVPPTTIPPTTVEPTPYREGMLIQ